MPCPIPYTREGHKRFTSRKSKGVPTLEFSRGAAAGRCVAHPSVVAGHFDHTDAIAEHPACIPKVIPGRAHCECLEVRYGLGRCCEGSLSQLGTKTPVVGPFRPKHPAASEGFELAGYGRPSRLGVLSIVATILHVQRQCHTPGPCPFSPAATNMLTLADSSPPDD